MNPLELALAIVVVVFVARMVRDRYRFLAERDQAAPSAEALHLRDEVRQLRDRVQVLERVITDQHGSLDLDREIERLRDR